MARIAYIRVSTIDQNTDRQHSLIGKVDKIFEEKQSGKNTNREQLQACLSYLREGDTLIVESISRLARSTRDLLEIIQELEMKQAYFVSLKENLDTTTPQGKFMLTIFGALYELERESILERQKEGIAIAKAKGKHLGRPVISKPKDFDRVTAKAKSGEITHVQAMKELGLSKTKYYSLMRP